VNSWQDPISKITRAKWTGNVAQVVEQEGKEAGGKERKRKGEREAGEGGRRKEGHRGTRKNQEGLALERGRP
jgi:hypothetical protein